MGKLGLGWILALSLLLLSEVAFTQEVALLCVLIFELVLSALLILV